MSYRTSLGFDQSQHQQLTTRISENFTSPPNQPTNQPKPNQPTQTNQPTNQPNPKPTNQKSHQKKKKKIVSSKVINSKGQPDLSSSVGKEEYHGTEGLQRLSRLKMGLFVVNLKETKATGLGFFGSESTKVTCLDILTSSRTYSLYPDKLIQNLQKYHCHLLSYLDSNKNAPPKVCLLIKQIKDTPCLKRFLSLKQMFVLFGFPFVKAKQNHQTLIHSSNHFSSLEPESSELIMLWYKRSS